MTNFVEVKFPGLGWAFNVNPVAFRIGSIEVYWYGLLIALALVLSVVLAIKQSKSLKFPEGLVYDTILMTIPCAIIGARAYFVACNWDYYGKDLKAIFDLRSGGLAIYGGVILVFIGGFIMCYVRKIPFRELADYCVVYLPLGQAIGRWGNFFNQECFGTTTNLPWGMTSSTIEAESIRRSLSRHHALILPFTELQDSLSRASGRIRSILVIQASGSHSSCLLSLL